MCKSLGVADRDINTNCLSLDARYKDNYERRNFIHYVATNTMAISVKDPGRLSELRKQLIKAGVNRIVGVQFKSSDFKQHREKARHMACEAALEKATKMLAVFKQKPGRLTSLSEGHAGNYFHYYGNSWYGYGNRQYNMTQNVASHAPGNAEAEDAGLALGKIAIRAQVAAQFALAEND